MVAVEDRLEWAEEEAIDWVPASVVHSSICFLDETDSLAGSRVVAAVLVVSRVGQHKL